MVSKNSIKYKKYILRQLNEKLRAVHIYMLTLMRVLPTSNACSAGSR